jgi:hypothetical protein
MGDENEPGIIPRALKDVFGYIRKVLVYCRDLVRFQHLRVPYLESYPRVPASRVVFGDLQ